MGASKWHQAKKTSKGQLFDPFVMNFFRKLSPKQLFKQRQVTLPDLTGLRVVTISSILVISGLLGLRQIGGLQALELAAFDQMVRMQPNSSPDPRLLLVEITEEDIKAYNRFPLSDDIIARTLEKLQYFQPSIIGLDLYRDIPYEPGNQKIQGQLEAENIIVITKLADAETIAVPPPPNIPKERVGFNDLVIDPDGIIRRNLMYGSTAEGIVLSFSMRLATRFLVKQGMQLSSSPDGYLQISKAVFPRLLTNSGGYQTIDAQGYQTLLNYRTGDRAARTITISQLLYGRVERDWVEDKIVLIGTTAPSGKDLFNTPYSALERQNPKMAGVDIHAQILSQILATAFAERPLVGWWPEWGEIVWIASWAILGGVAFWVVRHPLMLISGTTVMLGVLAAISFGLFAGKLPYLNARVWVPVSTPILGFTLTGTVVLTTRGYAAGRHQQIVMKLLGQNTSPAIARALWKSRDRLLKSGTLPGQKLTATILFTDLKNFSSIAEQIPPEQLMKWLNELLDVMTQQVAHHQGIINKFTGDGIMAVFGVPVARTTPEAIAADAKAAVACALDMDAALETLNRSWASRNLPVVKMRVGIFTGPVVAGSLGGKNRLEYGLIGDSVNIASRLESCEKNRQPCTCRILIARETLIHLQNRFEVEPWGPLTLKGKQQTVEVYRVIGYYAPSNISD